VLESVPLVPLEPLSVPVDPLVSLPPDSVVPLDSLPLDSLPVGVSPDPLPVLSSLSAPPSDDVPPSLVMLADASDAPLSPTLGSPFVPSPSPADMVPNVVPPAVALLSSFCAVVLMSVPSMPMHPSAGTTTNTSEAKRTKRG
jgi:hypothetical protein